MLNHVVTNERQVKTCRVCRLGEFPGTDTAFGSLWSNTPSHCRQEPEITDIPTKWSHTHKLGSQLGVQSWGWGWGCYTCTQTHRERTNKQNCSVWLRQCIPGEANTPCLEREFITCEVQLSWGGLKTQVAGRDFQIKSQGQEGQDSPVKADGSLQGH
jgi:hypothetical protein